MKMIRHALRSPHVRQVLVAVAVASAGAAVAGAVVLAERPARSGAESARVAVPPLAGGAAAAGAEQVATRSPKDAWRRVPSPWAHEAAIPATAADPSLPSEAEAVGAAPDRGDDAPPSF